jgi:beta-glucosidase
MAIALLSAGIEPWICLYHWDLPQSLDDLGGWQNCDIAEWFADYMTLVGQRYGNRVKPLWRSRQAICQLQ